MKFTYKKLLFLCSLLFLYQLRSDQVWHGGSTPDVFDENLVIQGECLLSGNVSITSSSTDVTATVISSGAEEPIVRGSGYVLELITSESKIITFDLTGSDDLTFEGGLDGYLRIIQRGTGTVKWLLNGGRSLILRNSTLTGFENGNGVQYFISMENNEQSVIIQRADATNLHAGFKILNDSLMTFIAPTLLADNPTEYGAIVFDTAQENSFGRTYLELGEEAGFVVTGSYVTDLTDPSSVVVHLSQPAGKESKVIVKEASDANPYASLLVINGNIILPQLFCDPTRTGGYNGERSGFILANNSTLDIKNNSYLDYVGTTTNIDPLISSNAVLNGRKPETVLKERNASALIIDGAPSGTVGATDARILMEGDSGIFFRSGADSDGVVTPDIDLGFSFTINPTRQPDEQGNIVFELEAALNIIGDDSGTSVLNILSREVASTGGYIELDTGDPVFPRITFARDAHYSSFLAQYAKSCFFHNNRLNLSHVIIRHDDFFHMVNATNTPSNSEPCYIGGDTFKLVESEILPRPKIALYNSAFNLHTSAALTGFDLLVTNTTLNQDNHSYIRYYQNGRKIDKGTGRSFVLGTTPGSYAFDLATVVDNASYFDIYQTVNQTAGFMHQVDLETAANNSTEIEGITGDISGQYSTHTFFLGYESNIQIGSQSAPAGVTLTTLPKLYINGNFFSFMSQGGTIGQPELSGSTGEGGIFVDINGTIEITTNARANFNTMVVQGDPTSSIILPQSRVLFSDKVGIACWDLNLADKQIVVASSQSLSDFTIDWMATRKDYDGGFIPFEPIGTIGTTVSAANLYHIPEVRGTLNDLQIKRSRLGDPVHIMVDGGLIRQLIFLKGYNSSEASTGLVAIKNDGRVGLGNNQTSRESVNAAIVLGVNGVTIVPDGNGVVDLRENLEINSVCSVIAGPNFGALTAQELYFNADEPVVLWIKRGGILDLSSFTSDNQRIVFSGKVTVIFEPGSTMLLGGGTVMFTNQSHLNIQNVIDDTPASGIDVRSTDDFRIKFVGTGMIILDEDASMSIGKESYLGIEWSDLLETITSTNLTLSIRDNASVHIGTPSLWGGALQVGNTVHKSGSVNLLLELNGPTATFEINNQGFFGIGVGIVDKHDAAPNNWRVGSLFDVGIFKLHVLEGTFQHNQIVPGTSAEAALMAIGPASRYYLEIDHYSSFNALGGGNMIKLNSGVKWVNPVVLDKASDSVGLFSSLPLIKDRNNRQLIYSMESAGGTSQDFFNVFKSKSVSLMASPAANFAQVSYGSNYIGYLFNNTIERKRWVRILGGGGFNVPPDYSLRVGAVAVNVNRKTGVINNVVQIVS